MDRRGSHFTMRMSMRRFYTIDQRILEKVGKLGARFGSPLHALQLLPDSSEFAGYASIGSRN